MANPALGGRFEFGRVIERTFKTVAQNFVTFLLLSALLTGIPAIVGGWFALHYRLGLRGLLTGAAVPPLAAVTSGFGLVAAIGVVNAIATAVLQAALIYGTVAFLNGRRADFGECVAVGLRYCLWLIVLVIVMGFAELFGFVFFIVPGVMMMLAWIVAVPVLVVERKGVFGSIGRSAELTRNHRWAILGLVFLYAIVSSIIQQALGATVIAAMRANAFSPVVLTSQLIITTLARIVFGVVSTAGVASIYYELRSAKEGIGPEALASVFD
ncbi:MAG TPA: hypothetical protein VJP88_08985 [Caulobacteraceae bacterium]|nr:hypothetical protein [Caulobacteraceae bacterium]